MFLIVLYVICNIGGMLILITASLRLPIILMAIDVVALAVATTTGGRLGTRRWAECRTAIVAVVESTLGAMAITSTCHLYVVAVCTNGAYREETYCTETHQGN